MLSEKFPEKVKIRWIVSQRSRVGIHYFQEAQE
jgi:hypothetical protein